MPTVFAQAKINLKIVDLENPQAPRQGHADEIIEIGDRIIDWLNGDDLNVSGCAHEQRIALGFFGAESNTADYVGKAPRLAASTYTEVPVEAKTQLELAGEKR